MADRTDAIADLWRAPGSPDFDYFRRAEEHTDDFWRPGALFREAFDGLDREAVLEIACGAGRHSERAAPLCGRLTALDTSADALERARERLAPFPHAAVLHSPDGMSVPLGPDADGTLSALFSYDAMVHFEPDCVAAYLREAARLLRPGGLALLHHSNYGAQPGDDVTQAPGWRNFMTSELLEHLASRAGLEVAEQQIFEWVLPDSDALTLLRKPGRGARPQAPSSAAPGRVEEHPEWRRRLVQARDEVLPWIEETVPLAGLTVLEYGCGQGAVSVAVAERCGRHIGLDIDADAVAAARAHLAGRGLTDSEIEAVPATAIVGRMREHAGEVDVILLYAVLEHLSIAERLSVLTAAREVVRPDGHIVICETPNRLTPFDHHTSELPFLHALPAELAERFYETSLRQDFREAVRRAATRGPRARREALVRWGTGMSFHEAELIFGDLAAHTIASSYHPLLYPGRPVRAEELRLAAFLGARRPDLPPCWSRSWLDMVLTALPMDSPRRDHVWPLPLALPHDVPGVAVLADGRLELRPGARVPFALVTPTDEVHVGFMADDPDAAVLHAGGSGRGMSSSASISAVPQRQAATTLEERFDRFELELRGGGCLTYVGAALSEPPVSNRDLDWF